MVSSFPKVHSIVNIYKHFEKLTEKSKKRSFFSGPNAQRTINFKFILNNKN